jgi:hypothetical protein
MFSDLANSNSIKEIELGGAKAYPSVNSPNDGGFNSEQNLRQFIKSVATKPFIIGDSEEDIAKSFSIASSNYGMYFDSAMFSIDGYVFKLAKQDYISYDSDYVGMPASVFNTMYLQRFVFDLCGCGKEDSLRLDTNMGDFCLSEYNPSDNSGWSDWSQLRENWEDAVDADTPIGYVRIAYTDTYVTSLEVDTVSGIIQYKTDTFTKEVSLINYDSDFEKNNKVDPDYIKDYLMNHSMEQTEPFGCVIASDGENNPTQINIYYPIFVKTINNKKYIVFTDIYNILYKHDQVQSGGTKCYPSTKSLFVDMDMNTPLETLYPGVDPSNRECQFYTLPTISYDYGLLYEDGSGGTKGNRKAFGSQISGSFEGNAINLSNYFTKVEFDDIKNIQSSESGAEKIPYVRNTISYYCLNGISNSDKLYINNSYVPIAFMTSEGSLCTNGFIYSNGGIPFDEQYPLESYVHFVKRKTASYKGVSDIDSITISDINDYINNGGGNDVYTKYIAPAISVYLALCYSSIMQYAVTPTFNSANDYKNIQSMYCGEKLSAKSASNPNVTSDDFATYYDFTYVGYDYSGTGNDYTQRGCTEKLRYNFDRTSDNWKLSESVIRDPNTLLLGGDIAYTYSPISGVSDDSKYLHFEDPGCYLIKCSSDTIQDNMISNFVLDIVPSGGKIEFTNVCLDEFLVPTRANRPRSYYTNDSYKILAQFEPSVTVSYSGCVQINTSMINSMRYSLMYNTWFACLDYVATVSKDSQGYLCGRNIDKPGIYDGLNFYGKLPQDVSDEDLYLFKLGMSTTSTTSTYNTETSAKLVDSTSGDIPTRRQAFLHTSKIYGDDYKNFDECVSDVVNVAIDNLPMDDIQQSIENLGNSIEGLSSDMQDLENDQEIVKDAVQELIDDSHKNLYDGTNKTATSNYVDIPVNEELDITKIYTLYIGHLTGSSDNNSLVYLVDEDNNEHGSFLIKHGDDVSTNISIPETLNTSPSKIRVYYGSSKSSSGPISCTNIMICLKDYFAVSPDYVPYKETLEQKLENNGYSRLLYTYCSENNTYYVYGSSDNDNEKTCVVKKGALVGHINTINVFEDETIRSVNVLPGVEYIEGAIGYNDITISDTVISASIHGDVEDDTVVESKGPKFVRVNEGVTTMRIHDPDNALIPFYGANVQEAVLPSTLTDNEETFCSCEDLKKITLSCPILETGFCDDCQNLDTVIISNNLQMIQERTFYNCSSIKTITYNGTTASWGNVTKQTGWDLTGIFGDTSTRITRVDCLNGWYEFSEGSWHVYTNT